MKNTELFLACLNHPEPFIEDSYAKEKVIITSERWEFNSLMEANNEIIEKITAYKVALEFWDKSLLNSITERIIELLNVDWINNTEFSNYWWIHDISFSIYEKFTDSDKKEFLKKMIEAYIISRHIIYQEHWYSHTTLQVRSDSVAHKRSGELWSNKVQKIFTKYWFSNISHESFETLIGEEKWYILADKGWSNLFDRLIKDNRINFEWGKNHQWKRPDFVYKNNRELFVMEHKHMKEWGWGQNKQIVEVIDFIKQNEKDMHYVTFLDWIFFNSFIGHQDRKLKAQYNQILNALERNPNNYFVNTFWFEYLLWD